MGFKSGLGGLNNFIMGMVPGGNRSRNSHYEDRIRIQRPGRGPDGYLHEPDIVRLDRELQRTQRGMMRQAQEHGYHQGLQQGQAAAMPYYSQGYGYGQQAGYSYGQQLGYSHGRREGYGRGRHSGYSQGYDDGYDSGYDRRGQAVARSAKRAYDRGWAERDIFQQQQNVRYHERGSRHAGPGSRSSRVPSRGSSSRSQGQPGQRRIGWDYVGKPTPPGFHGFAETIYEGSVAGR